MTLTFLFVFYLSLFCFECCDIVIMYILFCMTVLLHDASFFYSSLSKKAILVGLSYKFPYVRQK